MTDSVLPARCVFYVREMVPLEGRYTYTPLNPDTPMGMPMQLHMPPMVGDMILLYDNSRPVHSYRVVNREISYPALGSAAWPYGEPVPTRGPFVTYVVEISLGLFQDEIPAPSEDETV